MEKYVVECHHRAFHTNHYFKAIEFAKKESRYGRTAYVWDIRKSKIVRVYRSGEHIKLR